MMIDAALKETIWRQFGASIDMLENAVTACPEKLWTGKGGDYYDFWYITYHNLFWLDFYMSESKETYSPPSPFGMEEFDPAGALPPRVYTKEELLRYLALGRNKARAAILALTQENSYADCGSKRPGLTNLELLLYVMRHIQHHAAQLNLLLRQNIDSAPQWIGKTKLPLQG